MSIVCEHICLFKLPADVKLRNGPIPAVNSADPRAMGVGGRSLASPHCSIPVAGKLSSASHKSTAYLQAVH